MSDPLALVWTATAHRLGLRIARSSQVFAATDGQGTLTLGATETLDPDDHLAQMVMHEICHWIVAGEGARRAIDWGFEPMEGLAWQEYPTLRLQWALAERYGLQALMAPTTVGRAYWDRIVDPLAPLSHQADDRDEERIIEETRRALRRSEDPPWSPWLGQALEASAAIVQACRAVHGSGVLVPLLSTGAKVASTP